MPKLDTKTLRLSDGTELTLCATWNALLRIRKAVGFDLTETDADKATRNTAKLMEDLPKVIQALLATAQQRDEVTTEFLGDAILVHDAPRIFGEVMRSIQPDKPEGDKPEGQQNIPFVNGVPEPSVSISNAPMPLGEPPLV